MKNRDTKVRNVLTFLLLLILLAIFIYPIYVILINSFKVRRDIVAEPLAFMGSQGWSSRNYTEAFRKMVFPRTFMNSLIITVSSVCLIILTSSLAAYIFARKQWKIN